MKTLFDILGAHPDDDAENLKRAFRKAVKANHPDLHADDPNASMRIRRIINAYSILRDEKKRAAYERRLAFEREPSHSKPVYTFSYTTFDAAVGAIVAVGLTAVLIGGYMVFRPSSEAPVDLVEAIDVPGPEPAKGFAIQPTSQTDTADRQETRNRQVGGVPGAMPVPVPNVVAPQANSAVPGIADEKPIPRLVEREPAMATIIDTIDTPVDRAGANITGSHFKKESAMRPPDRNNVQSFGGQVSSPARNNGIMKPSLVELTLSSSKHDVTISGKPHATVKPQDENLLVGNGNTSDCSGSASCVSRAPPLFGVAF
jgi:hypothetical protein